MKKVLCMLIMTIAIGIMGGGTRTYADEIKDNSEIEEQYFEILAYDAENNRSLDVLSTHNANAEVAGNGVRLRNNPNTNSKILELMYSGELVWIDWSKYGKGGLEWFYVQRLKTGTYGWVNKEYIAQWD